MWAYIVRPNTKNKCENNTNIKRAFKILESWLTQHYASDIDFTVWIICFLCNLLSWLRANSGSIHGNRWTRDIRIARAKKITKVWGKRDKTQQAKRMQDSNVFPSLAVKAKFGNNVTNWCKSWSLEGVTVNSKASKCHLTFAPYATKTSVLQLFNLLHVVL